MSDAGTRSPRLINAEELIIGIKKIHISYFHVYLLTVLCNTIIKIIFRSGFMRMRIIYETDESPGSADTTANK